MKFRKALKFNLLFLALLYLFCACCPTEKVRVVRYLSYNPRIGESFGAVACRFGVTEDALSEINPDIKGEPLQPGRYLKVPVSEYTYNVMMVEPQPVGSCPNLGREYVCGRPLIK